MTKREIGENYFKDGYNCAQSVVLTYASEIGIDKETITYLKGELDKLEPIIKEMIESTKNIQIKTKLLEMYNENKEIIEKQAQEYIEKVEKNTNDTTQETIEKLLGK